MTDTEYRQRMEKELTAAYDFSRSGQEGKARVCGRRAAAEAIGWYLERHPGTGWGGDVMSRLFRLAGDPEFPEEIRSAAERLSSRITAKFSYPPPFNPVEDAKLITEYFRRILEGGTAR